MKPSNALKNRRKKKNPKEARKITFSQPSEGGWILNGQETTHDYYQISDNEFKLVGKPQWKEI